MLTRIVHRASLCLRGALPSPPQSRSHWYCIHGTSVLLTTSSSLLCVSLYQWALYLSSFLTVVDGAGHDFKCSVIMSLCFPTVCVHGAQTSEGLRRQKWKVNCFLVGSPFPSLCIQKALNLTFTFTPSAISTLS